jgi:hypothetical protein
MRNRPTLPMAALIVPNLSPFQSKVPLVALIIVEISSETVPFFTEGIKFLGPRNLPSFGVITGRREGVEKTFVGCMSPSRTCPEDQTH